MKTFKIIMKYFQKIKNLWPKLIANSIFNNKEK